MTMENRDTETDNSPTESFDLDTLLHPARAFAHPMEVVRDCDLTLNEKRAILASWASDACAVEAAPDLRAGAGGAVVRWDDIMDAVRLLDREAASRPPLRSHARWQWRRWRDRSEGGESDRGPQFI
jgi:hypothetical protein